MTEKDIVFDTLAKVHGTRRYYECNGLGTAAFICEVRKILG